MKKTVLALIAFVSTISVSAQQMAHFSQYMINDFYINPAVAGTKGGTVGYLTLRNQWTSFEGAPKTQTLSGHTNIIDGMGLGATIINDKTGPISQTGIELAYAYQFDVTKDGILSLGLSGKIWQYALDQRELTLDQQDDMTITGTIDKKLTPDAAFGAYYYSDKYYAGISVPQLFQTRLRFDDLDSKENKEVRHYFLNGGYKFELDKDFVLEPSLLLKTIFTAPTSVDVNIKGTYKDMFWGGLSYRHKDAIVVMLGLQYEQFKMGYAYDATLSNIRNHSYGSHEVFIGFELKDQKSKSRFY